MGKTLRDRSALSTPAAGRRRRWAVGALVSGSVAAMLLATVAVQSVWAAEWNGRVVLDRGHADALHLGLSGDSLSMKLREDITGNKVIRSPSSAVIQVTDAAKQKVPADPAYRFLGSPGDDFWLIPQVQNPDVIWAGWDTEEIEIGQLQGDRLTLTLNGVSGPGAPVKLYSTGTFGQPTPLIDSSTGLLDLTVPTNAHVHANWAFSAAGVYELSFRAEGVTAAGVVVEGSATYQFVVGDLPGASDPVADWNGRLVLDGGHVDAVHVALDGNRLSVRLREDVTGSHVVHDPQDVVIQVTDAAKFAIPDAPGFEFLGPAGGSTWLIPEVQNSDVVWAGWDTEEINPGQLKNDVITMELASVTGPGTVHLFNNGPVGEAVMIFDPQAGLRKHSVPVNAHAHANWAFSAAGVYELSFRAEGVTAAGAAVEGSATYQFVVGDLPGETDPGVTPTPTGPGVTPSPSNPDPTGPGVTPTDPGASPSPTGPGPSDPDPPVGGSLGLRVRALIGDEDGVLVLSADSGSGSVVLSKAMLAPSGGHWVARGALGSVSVTDTRVGSPGWNVVGRVGSFSASGGGAGGGFGGRFLGWTPVVSRQSVDRAVVAGAVVVPGLVSGEGLGRSSVLGSVGVGSGRGVSVLGAGLELNVPAATEPGTYDATLTLTVI